MKVTVFGTELLVWCKVRYLRMLGITFVSMTCSEFPRASLRPVGLT
jgi:hypothetical protein